MEDSSTENAYRLSGVDIDAQEEALRRIRKLVRKTRTKGVLSDVGSFGGLFRPELAAMNDPILVASADGVGTKLILARMAGDYSTVGRDIVNHCVNDILVQGAIPLFFLDYVGAGVLDPDRLVELVGGVAAACRENGCALLGGETAEMPGFYQAGDYELVGFVVGVVDRPHLLDGSRVKPGDVLVGLPSTGLHTNGYSLARKVFFEQLGLAFEDRMPGASSSQSVGELLLEPHKSYITELQGILDHPALHAMAHVTGGGITDNLPRVLPKKCHANIKVGAWEVPEIFHLLQEHGGVSAEEMFRVFNMGIGMLLIVDPQGLGEILAELRRVKATASLVGTVQKGGGGVVYDLGQLPTAALSEGSEK
jgi:phosphoribosylformylglycinamidine cyclo-ligase